MYLSFIFLSSFVEIKNSFQDSNLSTIYNKLFGFNGFFKRTKYIFFKNNENSFLYYCFCIFKFFFLNECKKKKLILLKSVKVYEFCFYYSFFFLPLTTGLLHPITKSIEKIFYFFNTHGFFFISGNEIENVRNNFFLLNITQTHAVLSDSDTFYFSKKILLRTHTSPIQIRCMCLNKTPFGFISIGKVYRRDYDSTHTPMFFQTEGLVISNVGKINYLLGILFKFLYFFYNDSYIKIRVRSSYFPFTEPSFEIDIKCFYCNYFLLNTCFFCNNTGWIEVLGAGCVHNKVLINCSLNINKNFGFAFGIGVDRLTSIYYKILDLRLNFFNNLFYLNQF